MKISKPFSRNIILHSALVVISFLLFSCASDPSASILTREGSKFNRELSQAIKSADKITIEEHSFWEDFKGGDLDVDVRIAPKYTYRSRTLSAADRSFFASQVDNLSGSTKRYDHEGCMFAPHYTIQFYENGVKSSRAQVSYRCEDFQWKHGTDHTQSKNLFRALSAVIKRAGFNPSSDWKKKASDRYRAEQRKKKQMEQEKEQKQEPTIIEIPTAKSVPGKDGLLAINPFTQNHVDVEGIPSGVKIRDPQDPKGRVFKVP